MATAYSPVASGVPAMALAASAGRIPQRQAVPRAQRPPPAVSGASGGRRIQCTANIAACVIAFRLTSSSPPGRSLPHPQAASRYSCANAHEELRVRKAHSRSRNKSPLPRRVDHAYPSYGNARHVPVSIIWPAVTATTSKSRRTSRSARTTHRSVLPLVATSSTTITDRRFLTSSSTSRVA